MASFVFFNLKYSGPIPKGLSKRVFNNVLKRAYAGVMRFWHLNFKKKHFTTAGGTEYGYKPRKGERGNPDRKGFDRSYTGRKLRFKGHTRPLVFSGRSMRSAMASNKVVATSKGARAIVNAPALNFRNPHSNIDMRSEMTTVSAAERSVMIRLFNTSVERGLRRAQSRQTKKVA